jgi:hypothetical protein
MSVYQDSNLRVDAEWLSKYESHSVKQLLAKYSRVKSIECSLDVLRCKNLHSTLYKLDWLLLEDGKWEIECHNLLPVHGYNHRSYNQLQYAFSNLFRGRYVLVSRDNAVLKFIKQADRISGGTELREASFGFISDGSQCGQLDLIFEKIFAQTIIKVEVLLCGPVDKHRQLAEKYPRLILLPDYKHRDIRPPINVKKRMLIEAAKFDNLVIAHDRFFFDSIWFKKLVDYGNCFDFYNCRRCDWSSYPEENRVHGDWSGMRWPATAYGFEPTSYSVDYKHSNPNIYLNGGLYIGKTACFKSIPWPDHLNWGDMEDVHYTRLIELSGAVIQMDFSNRVFTTTKRLARVRQGNLLSHAKRLIFSEFRRMVFKLRHGVDFID